VCRQIAGEGRTRVSVARVEQWETEQICETMNIANALSDAPSGAVGFAPLPERNWFAALTAFSKI
jgi:hypothetical protein